MQLILIAVLGLVPSADAEPDAGVRKLQAELVKVLKKGLEARRAEFIAGRATLDSLLDLAAPLRDAELAVATKPAERVAAHLEFFKLMVMIDEMALARYEVGRLSAADFYQTRAARLKAEIDLLKAGGKPPKGTKPPAEPKPAEKGRD